MSDNFDLRHDQMCVGKGDARMQLTCSAANLRHNLVLCARFDGKTLSQASITPAVRVTQRPLHC